MPPVTLVQLVPLVLLAPSLVQLVTQVPPVLWELVQQVLPPQLLDPPDGLAILVQLVLQELPALFLGQLVILAQLVPRVPAEPLAILDLLVQQVTLVHRVLLDPLVIQVIPVHLVQLGVADPLVPLASRVLRVHLVLVLLVQAAL